MPRSTSAGSESENNALDTPGGGPSTPTPRIRRSHSTPNPILNENLDSGNENGAEMGLPSPSPKRRKTTHQFTSPSGDRFIAGRSTDNADPSAIYKKESLDYKMRDAYLRVSHDGRMFLYGSATQMQVRYQNVLSSVITPHAHSDPISDSSDLVLHRRGLAPMRSKLFSYFSPSASLANRLSAPQFLSLPSFPTTSSTTTPPLITSPPTLSPQAIPAIRPSIHSPGRVPLGEWTGAQKYRISELSDNTMRYLNERCKPYRSICSTAYKVLDAPELEDNFYLNLVDWGKHDKLTVGLKNSVYIYNVQTAVVDTLARVAPGESTGLYPAALKWIGDGTTLAWGNRRGDMDIYDVTTQKKIHTLDGHIKRIGVIDSTMGWLVASGSEDNTILVRDTRDAKHVVTKITAHNNEVCGLKFSAFDEPVLASGGNDNKLFIWDLRKMSPSSSDSPSGSSSGFTVRRGRLSTTPFSVLSQQQQPPMPTGSHDVLSLAGPSSAGAFGGNVVSKVPDSTANPGPLFHLSEHRAAVRGLAWSPHVRGLLASGGGRQDPIIRFWNTSLGYKIDQLQCHAQVTNLAWSSTTDELLSTHGFPHQAPPTGGQAAMPGVVTVWHYPTRVPNISFAAHNCRVSYLAVAPDGQGIATASGDETLRFFNLFPPKSEAENAMGAELVGRVR